MWLLVVVLAIVIFYLGSALNDVSKDRVRCEGTIKEQGGRLTEWQKRAETAEATIYESRLPPVEVTTIEEEARIATLARSRVLAERYMRLFAEKATIAQRAKEQQRVIRRLEKELQGFSDSKSTGSWALIDKLRKANEILLNRVNVLEEERNLLFARSNDYQMISAENNRLSTDLKQVRTALEIERSGRKRERDEDWDYYDRIGDILLNLQSEGIDVSEALKIVESEVTTQR